MNLLLNMIEFELTPFEAIAVPRFATTLHEDSFNPIPYRKGTMEETRKLMVNRGVSENVIAQLRSMEHRIELVDQAIGLPVLIRIDQETGMAEGVSDPKTRHYAGAVVREQ